MPRRDNAPRTCSSACSPSRTAWSPATSSSPPIGVAGRLADRRWPTSWSSRASERAAANLLAGLASEHLAAHGGDPGGASPPSTSIARSARASPPLPAGPRSKPPSPKSAPDTGSNGDDAGAASDATGEYTPDPRAPAGTSDSQPSGRPGTVVAGRYKLLEKIGEGGMGAVWVAEQTEPVKRSVAVKLIKAGMDSQAVLARFEAERQALALMDHPNIAKVLDAGATDDGRPFFVMELVKGVPDHRVLRRAAG